MRSNDHSQVLLTGDKLGALHFSVNIKYNHIRVVNSNVFMHTVTVPLSWKLLYKLLLQWQFLSACLALFSYFPLMLSLLKGKFLNSVICFLKKCSTNKSQMRVDSVGQYKEHRVEGDKKWLTVLTLFCVRDVLLWGELLKHFRSVVSYFG